jgi:hypothetical protein
MLDIRGSYGLDDRSASHMIEFTKRLTETSHSISDHLSSKGLKYGYGRVHAQVVKQI